MPTIQSVRRYHDISAGHRVVGHEGKCRGLHGHNYRIYFECHANKLDHIGRVIDFGIIKSQLCMWVEDNWDHKLILWDQDPLAEILNLSITDPRLNAFTFKGNWKSIHTSQEEHEAAIASIIKVPFNPTAEQMASYLLEVIGPQQLKDTEVTLVAVHINETMKCSATARLG